jgi:hypothetical protein
MDTRPSYIAYWLMSHHSRVLVVSHHMFDVSLELDENGYQNPDNHDEET